MLDYLTIIIMYRACHVLLQWVKKQSLFCC